MARETILIVDDEEDIIELIKYNLEKYRLSITQEIDGDCYLIEAGEASDE